LRDEQKNLAGAKDRPDLDQVWENVQAKLAGKQPMYEKYALTLTSFFVVMKEHFFPAGNPAGGLVTRTAYNYLGEGCMIVYLAVWTRFSSISNSVHRMYTQQSPSFKAEFNCSVRAAQ